MNREQIIKALECCASNSLADCDWCPMDEQKKDVCECGRYLAIQALALIRDLTEENEVLCAEISRYTENVKAMVEEAVLDFCDRIYDVSYEGRHGTLVEFVSIEDIVREMFGSKDGK